MKRLKKILKRLLLFLIILILILGIVTLVINSYVINYSKKYIISEEEALNKKFYSIVVLGASVKSNGEPSDMLQDRLDEGIVLYNLGVSPRIIMSGDHLNDDYDEVTTMKNYAIKKGILSDVIYTDSLGLNTYDSMYRLRKIYNLSNVVIVTQDYHQYRSIYIARKLGIDAYGVSSNPREYTNQFKRDIREIFARVKDFFKVMFTNKDFSDVTGEVSLYNN